MAPDPSLSIQQALASAMQHHQAGRLAEAEALYRQIIGLQPDHADALHLLGVIADQMGRPGLAVELISRAIALNPGNAAAHTNLGQAWRSAGRHAEAVASYRRALQLQPNLPEAHNNLGSALMQQGEFANARAAFARAIELRPGYAEAHNNLGSVLAVEGRFNEAFEAFGRAVALQPGYADAHHNLANALSKAGRMEEAIRGYRRVLELQPESAPCCNSLGCALREMGQFDEAIHLFRRAVQLRPGYPEAQSNLGLALLGQRRLDEALAAGRQAVQSNPNSAEALNNLGLTLVECGHVDEAMALYSRALQIEPASATIHNNLGNALKGLGQIDAALVEFRRAIESDPESAWMHSNLIYTVHFSPDADAAAIATEQQCWSRRFAEPLKSSVRSHRNERDPGRRLRIGYVSPEFRDHVTGRYLVPLLEHHDHERFEIVCYAGVARPDAETGKFQGGADRWRSSIGVADAALAEMIRQDGVDILVDLTQHLAGNRLPVFARQPAPVQVSFAGYPASTGLAAIPNRISDRYVESQIKPAEQVFLIDTFWCYDPCGAAVEANELPMLGNGCVTFGCLNNFCKVNERVLLLWARLLQRVNDARLVLLTQAGSHRQRVLEILAGAGIEGQRVQFVGPCPRAAYLELYHRIDIALDTFPYNGHTTSLDALWMGVPVISLVRQEANGRGGLSILSNVGLTELAAGTEEDFVEIAAHLAGDQERLKRWRSTLRGRMESSPLMDGRGFARGIETAYRTMWRRWCYGVES